VNFCLPEAFTARAMEARDSLDEPFWAAAAREELVVQHCINCDGFQWLPELICYRCHSDQLDFAAVLPRGTIFSWERAWYPVSENLDDAVPYVAVAVELESCPAIRMIGNLIGDPLQEIVIGTPVSAVFEHHSDYTLVQWRPAG
jgi:uncharacterized OB-fold protein